MDSRGGYILKILYVETKESGPLGGRAPARPPPQIRQWILKVLCEDVRVAKNEENFETMGF